jgi:hypothetical protein
MAADTATTLISLAFLPDMTMVADGRAVPMVHTQACHTMTLTRHQSD